MRYANSFGSESAVLTDLIWEAVPQIDIFSIDTGRLYPETYDLIERLQQRYGRALTIYYPKTSDWKDGSRERHQRISQRPRSAPRLLRHPQGGTVPPRNRRPRRLGDRHPARAAASRALASPVEWDGQYGLHKVSPLLEWSENEIWEYIRKKRLPYNTLHDSGFPSIGCAPCTRAVQPGEDERAGRWWWERVTTASAAFIRAARRVARFPPSRELLSGVLRSRGQKVLVVGGGEVALRKVPCSSAPARRSPWWRRRSRPSCAARRGRYADVAVREFAPDDLDGARLVIVATSRRAVNRWIASLSEARKIPVNVVDDREASRFIVPAIIDRDPVLVAVSTGGSSPVLARRLRERLEALIPTDSATWRRGSTTLRGARAAAARSRRAAALFRGHRGRAGGAAFRRGRRARRAAHRAAAAGDDLRRAACRGEVTLVGAGPGRSGTSDAQGAARAAGRRCDSARSPGAAQRCSISRGAMPSESAWARPRGSRHTPGGDQRTADRAREAGQARGPAQGRRSLHLRPRRRGAAGARAGADRFLSRARASPRRPAAPRMPAFR